MKVLGANRRTITRAYIYEYGLLGLMTALAALLIGTLAAWAMITQILTLPWTFDVMAAFGTTALALLITIFLGFTGTRRALKQPPAPLLRNE